MFEQPSMDPYEDMTPYGTVVIHPGLFEIYNDYSKDSDSCHDDEGRITVKLPLVSREQVTAITKMYLAREPRVARMLVFETTKEGARRAGGELPEGGEMMVNTDNTGIDALFGTMEFLESAVFHYITLAVLAGAVIFPSKL